MSFSGPLKASLPPGFSGEVPPASSSPSLSASLSGAHALGPDVAQDNLAPLHGKPGMFVPPPQIDEYTIVRPLGYGGMGQVFLGHDSLLDRPVAVKFLVTSTPTDQARLRFLQEARAIARLQHPNVVAIYRVGIVSGLPYLVSEFVTGRSLDSVRKPLPWRQVLRIGIDLCRGLSAVHRQGVLHRDIKPANAMLHEDGTTKLLDFGLAKLQDDLGRTIEPPPRLSVAPPLSAMAGKVLHSTPATEDAPSLALAATADGDISRGGSGAPSRAIGHSLRLTAEGAIIGTPAYMAPEMWRGEPATERADVYMLGAVLYELCCGSLPHDEHGRAELRAAVLTRDAQPLAERVPDIDRRFAAAIDGCLARPLDRRVPSAAALYETLTGIAASLEEASDRAQTRWPRLRSWLLSGGLLAAGAFAVLAAQRYQATTATRPAASAPRPRVAVLGLKVGSGEPAQLERLGRAFSELVGAELTAGEHLLVLPAERVEHMKIELGLGAVDSYPLAALEHIRRNLGPDLVVVGTIEQRGAPGMLRLTVQVQDCQSGAIITTATASGMPTELFALASHIGGELRAHLGSTALSPDARAGLRAQRPASPEVAQLYADGVLRLRRFDPASARRLLERVVEADPDYPLGHLALADALFALGYDERARGEVRRAFALSSNLRRADRSLIEARYRETTKEWATAFSLYRTLATIHPDQIEYSLDLAAAELRAERPAESLRTVQELRRLPEPLRSDPRLDLAEAEAQMEQSNFTAALQLLDHAAQLQEAAGANLLLARTLLLAAFARRDLGQPERALASAERALGLFTASGDSANAVESLLVIGAIYTWRGELERAVQVGEQTLKLLIDQENDTVTAVHLGNLAGRLCQRGELALAVARAEAGLLLGRQVGNREATGQALVILGQAALLRAELPVAEERYAMARRELSSLGDPRMTAWVDYHLGELRVQQGRLAEAAVLHERALTVREAQQLSSFAAESRMALANLSLLRGQAPAAERLARAALARFVEDKSADNTAWAQALLAQALQAQGRSGEAREFLLTAVASLAHSQNVLLQTRALALLAPAVAAAPMEEDMLRERLSAGLRQARQAGFVIEELELAGQLSELLPSAPAEGLARPGHGGTPQPICALARRAHGLGLDLLTQRAMAHSEPGCQLATERDGSQR
jgi:serine/threonine protein kinase/tetratricopeptide (TPR) repeat protein/TolB-like protein